MRRACSCGCRRDPLARSSNLDLGSLHQYVHSEGLDGLRLEHLLELLFARHDYAAKSEYDLRAAEEAHDGGVGQQRGKMLRVDVEVHDVEAVEAHRARVAVAIERSLLPFG